MITIRSVCNSFTILLALALAVPALASFYKVSKVEGRVQIWDSFSSDWRQVRVGLRVNEGTLVQLGRNSQLTVQGTKTRKGTVLKGFSLDAKDPIVTRLSSESLRKVELGGYFINLSEDAVGAMFGGGEQQTQPFLSTLDKAWDRMMALFEDESVKEADVGADESQLGSRSSSGSVQESGFDPRKEIIIKYPKPGATLFVGAMPTEIAVTWKRPRKGLAYKTIVWEDAKGSPEPVGVTSGGLERITIRSSGRYYVRIESVNGKWRSKSHLFIVSTLGQDEGDDKPVSRKGN